MMNRLIDRLRRGDARAQRLHLVVKKIGASRGQYQGRDELPTVLVEVMTQDNDKITLEMTLEQAAKVIEQMTYTYRAIVPDLRTRNYGGW
jgi:hypothetical protein